MPLKGPCTQGFGSANQCQCDLQPVFFPDDLISRRLGFVTEMVVNAPTNGKPSKNK
jgi:hypothetical protein